MKFIGQFIQDFIARFRSDVYLEKIADGTVANDKFLGLDSNNKIVKETVSGGGTTDLTSDVTGTLPLGNGGTGQTTAQAAINALAGGTTAGRYLRGNGSNVVMQAIQNSDIGTLNQDTTGVAAGLTASTSNSIGVGSIELGHADDTTIARSAAGIITVEGKEVRTIDRHIHIQFSSFRDDIGTTPHFVPWHTEDENTTNTNENIPFIAPYAGKLLELHYRTSKNTSGATATWELVQIQKTETVNSNLNDTLDTQTCTGPTNTLSAPQNEGNLVKVTFDSDATFAAGDMLALKITHDTDVTDANTKFYITTIWEYDLSSM